MRLTEPGEKEERRLDQDSEVGAHFPKRLLRFSRAEIGNTYQSHTAC